MEPGGFVHGLEPVGRLGYHFDVLLAGEQHAKAGRGPWTGRRRREPGSSWLVVEDRKARAEDEPTVGGRICGHFAAVDLDAFADTDETVTEAVALRASRAVVPYLDL
jgi:hypothetical protein